MVLLVVYLLVTGKLLVIVGSIIGVIGGAVSGVTLEGLYAQLSAAVQRKERAAAGLWWTRSSARSPRSQTGLA